MLIVTSLTGAQYLCRPPIVEQNARTNGCGHGNSRNEDDTQINHDFDVVYCNEEVWSEMMTILVDAMSFIDAE